MEVTAAERTAIYTNISPLAQRVNNYIQTQHSSIAAVAKDIGYSRTTVSRYLTGKYDSNPNDLESKLTDFLTRQTGEAVDLTTPLAKSEGKTWQTPVFFESRDAKAVLGVCQSCQEYIGLGIVVARSGYGKTYSTGTWINSHYFIPTSCAYPDRVLDLVEFLASNAGQDLLHNCVNGEFNTSVGSDYWSAIDGAYGYGDGRCKYVWFSYMFSGVEYYCDFENQSWWDAVSHPVDFSNSWATEEDAALVSKAKDTISGFVNEVVQPLPAYYNMVALPAEATDIINQLTTITNEYLTQFIGGQLDYVRGAAMCPDGKAILAMPSTAKHGEVSRIVPVFEPGTTVTTTRTDVHYIVTEYGVANLRAKSLRERARLLINIAHPKFRDQLWEAYYERYGKEDQ